MHRTVARRYIANATFKRADRYYDEALRDLYDLAMIQV